MTIKKKRKEYASPPKRYNQDEKERYPWDLSIQEAAGFRIAPFVEHIDPETAYIERSNAAPLYAISWGWNATKRLG